MSNEYRTIPTVELVEMWERERDRLRGSGSGDFDALYEMRCELDRRRDIPKPVVDVNFSNDYLTD